MDRFKDYEDRRYESEREEILERYKVAKRRNPKLTKGQFMMLSNPDKYKNEDSAARQFRKLESGETTGERLFKRSRDIRHYHRTRKVKGVQEYEPVMEKRRGGYEYGLWKAILTVEYTDQDGEQVQEQRSYIIRSSELDNNYDIPLIDDMTKEADEEYLVYWGDVLYHWDNAEIVGKEIIRIERTNKTREMTVVLD